MKITLSVIKADIGSIGGHIAPSQRLLETVRAHVQEHGRGLIIDSYISHTGDDIAILMTHVHGMGNAQIHKLAWVPALPARQLPGNRACTARGRI